jgi:hypothetical protein
MHTVAYMKNGMLKECDFDLDPHRGSPSPRLASEVTIAETAVNMQLDPI